MVRVETPAGAGFGDPFERDPARVLDDVHDGKLTTAAARRDYGVVITRGRLDEKETTRLRERKSHGR